MNLHSNLDSCVTCSTCLVHCPVAEKFQDFFGPRMLGPASERFRLLNAGEDDFLSYCSNCKNCDISCPHGVSVSNLNIQARLHYFRTHTPPFRDWVLAHFEKSVKIASHFPSFLMNFSENNILSRFILSQIGIHRKAPFPPFPPKTFRALFLKLKQPNVSKVVAFYPGCYINYYTPLYGIDFIRLLNAAGYRVLVPESFCCCGTPMYSNGFEKDTRKAIATNFKEFRNLKEKNIPVLSLCPSCRNMFNTEIPELFPDLLNNDEKLFLVDGEEFLLECIDNGTLTIPTQLDFTEKIIYHAPCHQRVQGRGLPGLELLQRLGNKTVVNADAGCCGMSGTYSFKKEKYEIGMAIGTKLFNKIKDGDFSIVATECGTCQIQILHGTGIPCSHPVSILRKHLIP